MDMPGKMRRNATHFSDPGAPWSLVKLVQQIEGESKPTWNDKLNITLAANNLFLQTLSLQSFVEICNKHARRPLSAWLSVAH